MFPSISLVNGGQSALADEWSREETCKVVFGAALDVTMALFCTAQHQSPSGGSSACTHHADSD